MLASIGLVWQDGWSLVPTPRSHRQYRDCAAPTSTRGFAAIDAGWQVTFVGGNHYDRKMSRSHGILISVALLSTSIVPAAANVATTAEIQAFVTCAAEYVHEHGTEEARRAFNEDERWHSGPVYLFVDGVAASGEDSMTFVFPPDPSREGSPWGTSIDSFGTDYFFELHRILSVVDAGWIYYAFTNPATGRDEPKSSYVMEIDWDGNRAAIGAGLYTTDLPGTCNADEVNAANVSGEPTERRLQQLVRCAALVVESDGYFARHELKGNPRWSDGSTYVFVMDLMGNQLMTSSSVRLNGNALHEWGGGGHRPAAFGGRDVVSIADSFGETFIYYRNLNPMTGRRQQKVGLLKRVVAQGVPVLVGSGYYVAPDQSEARPGCSDNFVTATTVRTRRDIQALVHCAAEYIGLHGTEEAYRSFHEDPRWDHPEHYVVVRLLEQPGERSRLLVYPPDRNREGIPGAALHEISASAFGQTLQEVHRVAETVGSGWVHHDFINRAIGTVEPKSSYLAAIDWEGQRAVVLAGLYESDLPGTCRRDQVNAVSLQADPSESRLQAFVRCAAYQVESLGFFAGPVFRSDPRWHSGSIRVIGVDATTSEVAFGGSQYDRPYSEFVAEAFGGRDVVGIVETFGEAFWYYMQPDRATGTMVPEVAVVRRALAHGVPLLVGASYRLPPESNSH